jgi:hypothetical protein
MVPVVASSATAEVEVPVKAKEMMKTAIEMDFNMFINFSFTL